MFSFSRKYTRRVYSHCIHSEQYNFDKQCCNNAFFNTRGVVVLKVVVGSTDVVVASTVVVPTIVVVGSAVV